MLSDGSWAQVSTIYKPRFASLETFKKAESWLSLNVGKAIMAARFDLKWLFGARLLVLESGRRDHPVS